jgi:hypothetical protein
MGLDVALVLLGLGVVACLVRHLMPPFGNLY